ncbi:MAG: histidine--tRNA ligase [Candidatus Taylorbacteria bacterium RIFCSPLOWO2_12_FULL_47_20]|uniref:Histidine--tRNA ligase n=2 Tax=Candidatus Tayloriibacteriota TaxID=1817919 RepID=A0A1G2P937_9BACT|nr:MAG: histidine--tRNA ligase [Candidatus Taylorbacteria bacterium RIFCSPLOWO2_02_FULL_46_40]OHA44838.1 MAG: histidine--tRNA ligase [Candidatus Taylorbacteria bacterium RIFCSPLOWO2_12_FULL_47_20]
MKDGSESKISLVPYKGVRDFYPDQMSEQNFILNTMRKVAESFGYEEYSASLLEPSELYKAKSGDEIVNEQTYSFTDRGGREVTLRPEMTPSLARMVAAKRREIPLPLRWFSIPNIFRYENPQRGRTREHWQLNVDIFGVSGIEAEIEVISVAREILRSYGAKDEMFEIRINNRALQNALLSSYALSETDKKNVMKILDRKDKMSHQEFEEKANVILRSNAPEFRKLTEARDIDGFLALAPEAVRQSQGASEVRELMKVLKEGGVTAIFSPCLTRGFDYYTRTVFEIFDTGENNKRALFGGGRYDDLLDIFGAEELTAFGFGVGDVTMRDFLETYGLLPKNQSSTHLYICVVPDTAFSAVNRASELLRQKGVNVAVDFSNKKIGDQIKTAVRKNIPFTMVMGGDEFGSGRFRLKELATGAEETLKLEDAADAILQKTSSAKT